LFDDYRQNRFTGYAFGLRAISHPADGCAINFSVCPALALLIPSDKNANSAWLSEQTLDSCATSKRLLSTCIFSLFFQSSCQSWTTSGLFVVESRHKFDSGRFFSFTTGYLPMT
jgi:hypothetical protein